MTLDSAETTGARPVVALPAPGIRRRLQSIGNVDTTVLKLSPQFLAALGRVAPKPRSRRLPWAIGLALATLFVVFAADPSMRALARERGHRVYARLFPGSAVTAPVASGPTSAVPALDPVVTVPVVADSAIATPAVPVAQAPVAPSGAVKVPSKKGLPGKGRPATRAVAHGGRG